MDKAYIQTPEGNLLRTLDGDVIRVDADFYAWMVAAKKDTCGTPVCTCCGEPLVLADAETFQTVAQETTTPHESSFRHEEPSMDLRCLETAAARRQAGFRKEINTSESFDRKRVLNRLAEQEAVEAFLTSKNTFDAVEITRNREALAPWAEQNEKTIAALMQRITGEKELSAADRRDIERREKMVESMVGLAECPWALPALVVVLAGSRRRAHKRTRGDYRSALKWNEADEVRIEVKDGRGGDRVVTVPKSVQLVFVRDGHYDAPLTTVVHKDPETRKETRKPIEIPLPTTREFHESLPKPRHPPTPGAGQARLDSVSCL